MVARATKDTKFHETRETETPRLFFVAFAAFRAVREHALSVAPAGGLRDRIAPGIAAVAVQPRADARPLIVIHGRGDGLIPVNHTSRPYFVASMATGGASAGIRYYEIERGQHFDAFLPLPGFAGHYVAMQPFFDASMDLMAARLRSGGASLPPSQVVRKEILASPGADAITIEGQALRIPR